MGENSSIEWTDHTFNPWRGCTKVAAGCANCYAEKSSKRNPATLGIWGDLGTRVIASEAMWKQPIKWNEQANLLPKQIVKPGSVPVEYMTVPRPRVFCASLADVFEDWGGVVSDSRNLLGHVYNSDEQWGFGPKHVGESFGKPLNVVPLQLDHVRARLFRLIDNTQNLDWLLLTKRPENIRDMWLEPINPHTFGSPEQVLRKAVIERYRFHAQVHDREILRFVRPNVWLGTSIACRKDLCNIRNLKMCRDLATVLFLSIEPLIEDLGKLDLDGIDWVIVGGESGSNARPMHPSWVRSIRDQCQAAKVPFFFKQWGEWLPHRVPNESDVLDARREVILSATGHLTSGLMGYGISPWVMQRVGKKAAGRLLDGREWNELPEVQR